MLGLCCQALVSLGPSSIPIKDIPDGFPAQAVFRPERGVRDFRMLARIGDDFFVALANLFERKGGVSHDLPRCLMIRTSIIAPRGAGSRQSDTHPNHWTVSCPRVYSERGKFLSAINGGTE
jgi:hypothetical protein